MWKRRKKKRTDSGKDNAELLPPREALSLLNTSPSAYTSSET